MQEIFDLHLVRRKHLIHGARRMVLHLQFPSGMMGGLLLAYLRMKQEEAFLCRNSK